MCKCNCQHESRIEHDPAQRVFSFARYVNKESHDEGYAVGIAWDASWMPGGPFTYVAHRHSTPFQQQLAAESKQHYEDWQAGFADGLAERLATNAHFAAWWNVPHAQGQRRYYEPMKLVA